MAVEEGAWDMSREHYQTGITVAEVFPEYLGRESQVALRAYRNRENLTQKELAERTGIPQHHISEMENGKRPIGKERARKLVEALGVGVWRMLVN